ncbi:PBSX family phage terminase large subunit [Cetobacterium sp. 2A]|uniref:PBSX family phage terminase large subunit n=1 Tax=Cetobacterium sp. 2A TaxID=2754723 RepID=UPI001C8EA848|nr:PBSX family phage terminase large subunit [Cetobacterium sp. 2A]
MKTQQMSNYNFTRMEVENCFRLNIQRSQRKKSTEIFNLIEPSLKQKKVMTWWREESPYKDYEGIVSDGSVRSGKTLSTSFSFLEWAMHSFNEEDFAFCAKTVGAFKRNILKDLKKIAKRNGYKVVVKTTDNLIIISKGEVKNYFYMFGGKDEGSSELIQGKTLAGVYFDEVVLMPETFVSMAMSRCSVEGSKFWFTCNPGSPFHWFKTDYIDKAGDKKFLYLHFTMEDNPSLSLKIKDRYKNLYTGVFYKRYILGLWVGADGLVYSFTDDNLIDIDDIPRCDKYYISGDYGTQNPMAWGFFGVKNKGREKYVYLIDEYHHSGNETQKPKDDSQYADEFIAWKSKLESEHGYIQFAIFDPSAASFRIALQNKHITVRKAVNTVKGQSDEIAGIPLVQTYLSNKKFFVCNRCEKTISEFYTYAWDTKKLERGVEEPIKAFDHHMDKARYLFNTVIGFEKLNVPRNKPSGF